MKDAVGLQGPLPAAQGYAPGSSSQRAPALQSDLEQMRSFAREALRRQLARNALSQAAAVSGCARGRRPGTPQRRRRPSWHRSEAAGAATEVCDGKGPPKSDSVGGLPGQLLSQPERVPTCK